MNSKWLTWTPRAETIEKTPAMEPTKPTEPSFVGFEGSTLADCPIIRGSEEQAGGPCVLEQSPASPPTKPTEAGAQAFQTSKEQYSTKTPLVPAGIATTVRYGGSCAPVQCPSLPRGVRLVRYEPKAPPISIDVCSVVIDIEKFIRGELTELCARLHNPVQIRGGWGVFTILDRLRQVGLEVEIDAPPEKVQARPTTASRTPKDDFKTPTGDGGAR